jgi:hypothetical protein
MAVANLHMFPGASETFKNPFQHNRHRNSDFVKEDWMNWKSVI